MMTGNVNMVHNDQHYEHFAASDHVTCSVNVANGDLQYKIYVV